MTGRTHVAVGLAAALAVTAPTSIGGLLAAVIGGCVGGVISDVDSPAASWRLELAAAHFVAVAVAVVAFLVDAALGAGLCATVAANATTTLVPGLALFALVIVAGVLTPHRSLTHSLPGIAAWTASVWMICAPIAPAFCVGLVSHVVLDLLNRQPVRLLYPLRVGFSASLCRADGIANNLLFAGCALVSAALLISCGVRLL